MHLKNEVIGSFLISKSCHIFFKYLQIPIKATSLKISIGLVKLYCRNDKIAIKNISIAARKQSAGADLTMFHTYVDF